MTRAQLVLEIASRANISPKESDRILRIITETIQEQVAAGEKITISGFGTFERRLRKATVARNPKTHEPMRIAQQYVAAFRAGSGLKDAVKDVSGREMPHREESTEQSGNDGRSVDREQ